MKLCLSEVDIFLKLLPVILYRKQSESSTIYDQKFYPFFALVKSKIYTFDSATPSLGSVDTWNDCSSLNTFPLMLIDPRQTNPLNPGGNKKLSCSWSSILSIYCLLSREGWQVLLLDVE